MKIEYGYKSPLGVTSQYSFCGLPFRLDTYTGCAFSCNYCFARLRGGNIKSKKLKAAEPSKIITKFKNAINNTGNRGIISEYIRRRMPLHFGGMSDPFQSIELTYKSSYDVLNYLSLIDYPVVISTKSSIVGEEPYLSLLKSYNSLIIQFSFSTFNNHISKVIEPNVDQPSVILKTIEKLSNEGIKTMIRWQPYIPFISESPTKFISKISNTGILHLGFEHLKLPLEKKNVLYSNLEMLSNIDFLNYYKSNHSILDGRELVLPSELKITTIKEVKQEANIRGITFGAADNDFQYLSDTDCCCSGIDKYEGFENWNKYNIGYAVKKGIKSNNGTITYSLISNEWKPQGAIDKFMNSKSRLIKGSNTNGFNTIEKYVLDRWENLSSPFNPTNYFGVTFKGEIDDFGLKAYRYNTK